MREILFRGKRIDNGEWVCGYYSMHKTGKTFIRNIGSSCISTFEVDPSTVGQFTGLTDKNGNEIFEGDIIRENYDGAVGVVRFGKYMSPSDPDHTRHIGYCVDWQGKEKDFLRADLGYWASRSDVEVVGNIHNNPELLEDNP